MYQQIVFATIMANLILNSYTAMIMTTSRPSPISSETSRILSILDLEDSKTTADHVQQIHNEELEQLGVIAHAFKNQFRDVIEELIIQAFKYLRATFHEIKLRVFKRLGRYTLSDLFHATFDGVADFVGDATTDAGLTFNAEEEPTGPGYSYSHYPYVPPHPYAMRSDDIIVKKITNLKEVFKKSLQATSGNKYDAKEDILQNRHKVEQASYNTEVSLLSPLSLSVTSQIKDCDKITNEPDAIEKKILTELHKPENLRSSLNASLPKSDEKENMLLSFLHDVRDMNELETLVLKREISTIIHKIKRNRASNFLIETIYSPLPPKIVNISPRVRTTSLRGSNPPDTTANSIRGTKTESFPELVLVNT